MKKVLVSLCSTIFLFSDITQLAPVILEAHEAYVSETEFAEKITETIVQDETGKYALNSEKVNQYNLDYVTQDLQTIIDEANTREGREPHMENMMVIAIGIGALKAALVAAGLGFVVDFILKFGIFGACKTWALDMYRRWSRTGNYGAYLFYNFCAASGWF